MHDPLQREGSRPRRTTFRRAPFMTFSSFRLKLAAAASLLAAAAVSVALLTGGTANGQTIAGQQATAAQLRAAVRAESRKIAATAEGIADAENRLAVLDARVQRRQQQAQDTQDKLIAARVRLTRLERNAAAYQKTLASNLVAAYKTPAPDLLGVAVEAKGFDDLLSQLRFLRDISDRNATILRDTRRARLAVASQTKDLAQLRLKLIGLAKQASDDRSQANVLRNALLRRQASQLARRRGAQSRLNTVRARIASLERQQAADALRNSAPAGRDRPGAAGACARRSPGAGRRRRRAGRRGRQPDRHHALRLGRRARRQRVGRLRLLRLAELRARGRRPRERLADLRAAS